MLFKKKKKFIVSLLLLSLFKSFFFFFPFLVVTKVSKFVGIFDFTSQLTFLPKSWAGKQGRESHARKALYIYL